ncbi:MAG: GGDEF domain-containing protein [Gemmatimonadetes bacterium]|nr:GGDEF domain-containing protein [Gemmatimonadota bacterium]
MSRLSPATLERVGEAAILGLGLLDYSLGPDLFFSVFYLLPIVAVAWYGDGRAGYFACAVSASVWLAAEILSREVQLPAWVTAWNAGVHLTTFLVVVALAIRLKESVAAQTKLALSDPLTGLANTRAFFDRLSAEIDRALRYGTIFTLAYMDLDHFKEVNDTLGHAEGDEVLRRVAETMRGTMRTTDLTARLGGDEFGILLPETPFGKAEGALGKLRVEIVTAMSEEGLARDHLDGGRDLRGPPWTQWTTRYTSRTG